MPIHPRPDFFFTSTEPLLHCCATWHALAANGEHLPNRPMQKETWDAITALQHELLRPLEEHYGVVKLTYGFSSPLLVKAIEKRAMEGGWLPNIYPKGDQHAGYELNSRGNRICKRDGIAVDLHDPGKSSRNVTEWIIENLPFDRIYLYSEEQPFHMSWAPTPLRVGQVIHMQPKKNRGWIPKVVIKGRTIP